MTKLRILQNPATAEADRRRNERIPEELAVRAEVTLCVDSPERIGDVAECLTRDISTSGLLVRSNLDLPVGCGLDLHLCLAEQSEPLTLRAQVKWNCEDSENQEFLIGMELREQPVDGYLSWCEQVRKYMDLRGY